MFAEISPEEKHWRLHQYGHFVSIIMEDIDKTHFDKLATFVVRTIGLDLLSAMNDDQLKSAEAACKMFADFVKCLVSKRPQAFASIFSFSVKGLIRLARRKSAGALSLLRLLFQKNDTLRSEVSKLDSFPNDAIFEDLRTIWENSRGITSLKRDIENFISCNDGLIGSFSVDSLQELKRGLKEKKEELHQLQVHDFLIFCFTINLTVYSLIGYYRQFDVSYHS